MLVSCYCDLDVICGFILFSFICNSFTLLANKYLLTYLYNICLSLLMRSHYLAQLSHLGMKLDKFFCTVLNLEFLMRNATYKNPAIGTVCHALHKGTLNNCHDIVFGHLKCTKTNIMATITFITFSHSNNHNVCHKLNN